MYRNSIEGLWLLALVFAATACGPTDGRNRADTRTDLGNGDTGMEMRTETGVDSGGDVEPDVAPAPVIEDLQITENPNNALSAYVSVETDIASDIRIELERGGEVAYKTRSKSEKKEHELLVLGMYADTDHQINVQASAAGQSTSQTKSYTSGDLPSDFPPLQVQTSKPDLAADGFRLIDLFRWKQSQKKTHSSAKDWGMAIAVDEHGKVVWYYKANHQVWDITRTDRGTLVYNADPDAVVEIDMAGKVLNEWKAKEDLGRSLQNDEFGVHHGVSPVSNDTFLALSTEMREISGYKSSEAKSEVVGDVAIEFDRNGTVQNTWSMFDVLEDYRTRKRVGSTGPYWDEEYGKGANDWTHGNAVEAGDTSGTLIASLRHQDWIVKWDKQSGDLLWRLGPEGDFEFASGNGSFNYHQHAPAWLQNGNLLVYDNGNSRPTISQGDQFYTRVVEFKLDASNVDIGAGTKGTVEQVWQYKSPPKFYAPFVGDADPLPNGNILIGDGGLLEDPSSCIDFDQQGDVVDKSGPCIVSEANLKWARILEVTHDQKKKKALELWIRDTSNQNPRSYTMYRADYIQSLSP